MATFTICCLVMLAILPRHVRTRHGATSGTVGRFVWGEEPHTWNTIHTFDLAGQPLGTALAPHALLHDLALRVG
ncbi:MAG: hypothetical protein M3457_19470 [Chloroflexota bacterium]|nr:hypothetical protein [Chloroflexota bacterium]